MRNTIVVPTQNEVIIAIAIIHNSIFRRVTSFSRSLSGSRG